MQRSPAGRDRARGARMASSQMEDFWQDEVLERQISHEKRKRQLTSRHQRAATELPPAARQQPQQQQQQQQRRSVTESVAGSTRGPPSFGISQPEAAAAPSSDATAAQRGTAQAQVPRGLGMLIPGLPRPERAPRGVSPSTIARNISVWTSSSSAGHKVDSAASRGRAQRKPAPPSRRNRSRRKSAATAVATVQILAEQRAAGGNPPHDAMRSIRSEPEDSDGVATAAAAAADAAAAALGVTQVDLQARVAQAQAEHDEAKEHMEEERAALEQRVQSAWEKTLACRIGRKRQPPHGWLQQHLAMESERVW
jgi:hypothetical protein